MSSSNEPIQWLSSPISNHLFDEDFVYYLPPNSDQVSTVKVHLARQMLKEYPTARWSPIWNNDPTTDQLVRLGQLALKLSRVNRVTLYEDGVTPESVTDHTVMLSLVACFVASRMPYLDTGKVAQFVLVHDLVEVYVGDTNTFDISAEDRAAKEEREAEARRRLGYEFPDVPWLQAMVSAYEAQVIGEVRLVRYLDKAMPKICHLLNDCATIVAMGKTREDLVRAHREQLEQLNTQYPELAISVGPLMGDIMRASEEAWPV